MKPNSNSYLNLIKYKRSLSPAKAIVHNKSSSEM